MKLQPNRQDRLQRSALFFFLVCYISCAISIFVFCFVFLGGFGLEFHHLCLNGRQLQTEKTCNTVTEIFKTITHGPILSGGLNAHCKVYRDIFEKLWKGTQCVAAMLKVWLLTWNRSLQRFDFD